MIVIRSDLLKKLFRSYAENNKDKFIKIAHEVIKEEEKMNHHLLAKDLKKIIHSNIQNKSYVNSNIYQKYRTNIPIPRDTDKGFPLLEIKENYFNLDDVILFDNLKKKIEYTIEEFKSREVLATYGLRPKQKLLFCGPPGTGKTLTSYVISSVLGFPLIYIRFDSIVSSFLGETATNLRKIFDFIEEGEWVVLFDEFDIIGKKRDDPYEHGEIKRVVNNFMQMLDNYKGKSLLISATNHQHLLDTAIWRRFDDILFFDIPDSNLRGQLFNKYLRVLKKSSDLNKSNLSKLTDGFTPADIAQVCEEAQRRAIVMNKIEISYDDIQRAIDEQKARKEIIQKV